MRLGLFASGVVGRAIVDFLAEQRAAPACLAVDSAASDRDQRALIEAAALSESSIVLRSAELYSPASVAALRRAELDLIVFAWWPYIVREPILRLPRLGCLNFHNSLLPHNRGKHPNFWSIVEGRPYGVTLHFADPGVDDGPIAFQAEVPISWEDTGGSLYQRGQAAIVQLFRDSWPRIRRGDIPRVPQQADSGSFHRARELEAASHLDLDAPTTARAVLNVLRARTFPPHPAASFEGEDGAEYEVRVQICRKAPIPQPEFQERRTDVNA